MKKLTLLITAVIFSISMSAQDPHWNTDGNAGTTPGTNFMGTTDNQDLWFNTNNGFKMALTSPAGWLGLNTTTPQMRFHVVNGGILSTGTTGTNPNIGMGTRFMWIPDLGAIRAGYSNGTEWDAPNVGDHSAAFGSQNTAFGDYSFAAGRNNNVETESAAAFGSNNSFNDALAAGRQGIDAFSAGRANYNEGDAGIALGLNNGVTHQAGVALGQLCEVTAVSAIAGGFQCESHGDHSFSVGYQAVSNGDHSVTIGHGINNIDHSMLVGFPQTGNILFAGPGIGGASLSGVGIGNVIEPTQRLDVDGTARLRQMPNEEFNVIITGVSATSPAADGDYILNYATIENFTEALNLACDWNVVNSGADVATGYTGACVEGQVLIGSDTQTGSNAKVFMTKEYPGTTLHVESTTGGGNNERAGYFTASNGAGSNTGVYAEGMGGVFNYGTKTDARQGTINYGSYGYATQANLLNIGLHGHARGGSGEFVPSNNVGVYGRAQDYAMQFNFGGYFTACDAERNIGVYAETCDDGGLAAYFVGLMQENMFPISLSDETIKTGIEEIGGALEIIDQLNPVQYQFLTDQYPHLNLSNDLSYGFKAQEVQEILPSIVEVFYHPAKFDTSGVEISPSEELLGIQYGEFIAILTAGIKAQQAQIESQDNQIAGLQQTMWQMQEQMQMMQDQLDGCCSGDATPKNSGTGQEGSPSEKSLGQNELYQNTPNPFRTQTTISYTLEQGGIVLLQVFDKTGKPIATLVEAEQPADTYRYEWDATGLPAGLYHYALYVDGELLVKKAIKLAD